jgi:hypothetical protein
MVSCDHAEYDSQLVRPIHWDVNPAGPGFRQELVPSAISARQSGKRVDPTRVTSALTMQIPPDVLAYVLEAGIATADGPARVPAWPERGVLSGSRPGTLRRLVVRLPMADRRRPHTHWRRTADRCGRCRRRGPDHASRATTRRSAPQPGAGTAARSCVRGRQGAVACRRPVHRDQPAARILARGRLRVDAAFQSPLPTCRG